MDRNNHKTIIVEFSDRFDKDMVFEEITCLCDKLATEYGLHIVTNDLSKTGMQARTR
ncbi:hypothetical protein [Secundilactobacillus similis]|uniref:hypothetical protein n=1 Tax=Secundilactobacillus similis TaxID=414682 RepID=UPI000ACC101C|nr:hypothetical protein [Secundilactobacillus similis]